MMNKIVVFLSTFFIVSISVTSVFCAQYWEKTYGLNDYDVAYSIQQTQDGGSIVAGFTRTFGTDSDAWVVKFDSTGSVSWEKRYGASDYDEAHIIQQTSDGGYIVLGCYDCNSTSDENTWLLKLASNGDITWQKTYPRTLYAFEQTSDGGYILTGGGGYIGVLKLDSAGTITWQKTYQEDYPRYEVGSSIRQTADGGYIVAGVSTLIGCSNCGKLQVLKLNSIGDVIWQKAYKGFNTNANCIRQTEDGGYIIAGRRGHTNYDFFVVKLDASGNMTWKKGYGDENNDEIAYSINRTSDGNYIVSGCYNCWDYYENRDIWFMKIDSSGDILGQKLCEDCNTFSLQQTDGGGFITAGVKSDDAGMLDVAVFNFDNNWEIPDCPVMEETTVSAYETSDYPEPPDVTTQSISEILTDTTVTPQDTSAVTNIACCYDIEDNDYDCVQLEADNCPFMSNPNQEDFDEDTVGDVCDNCPDAYNPNQEDTDSDSIGDACDSCPNDPENDADSDGVCGDVDNCPINSNPEQEDLCPPQGNEIGDACDCEGNFDCDEDCDGTDAAAFKVDFGRSTFLDPCTNEDQCKGDFDCDVDVDGTDAALFKADFGRSPFGNPCPVCEMGIEWCVYNIEGCVEDCETELDMCLLGCEELPPGSRDTCNDNCIFDYQYNCIPSCET